MAHHPHFFTMIKRRIGKKPSVASAVVFVALLLGACVPPPEETTSPGVRTDHALAARVDAAAEKALTHLPIAGLSVAVMRDGRLVLAKGYGYANMAKRIPATADTIYRLGSIGKEFTAAAVLDLAEQGRLSLSDSVSRYLSNVPTSWDRITIRDLLAHTSGLPEGAIAPLLIETGGVGLTRQDLFRLLASQPLIFDPGTGWSYSNAGYLLAGMVIERVTGIRSEEYLANRMLRRLGLTDTFPCPDEQPENRRWAHGYEVQEGNWLRVLRLGRPPALVDPRPINMEIVSSAGGLCSSAATLVRWPDLLRSSLLEPSSFRQMTKPTVLENGRKVAYGLGVQNRRFGSHSALAHGGVINGFVTLLANFPNDDLTVAILVNTLLPEESQTKLVAAEVLSAVFDERGTWYAPFDEVSDR
ncbi:MAG TPA: serine hydrolase domain-containing protein [Microvirga sp.]|nr:serine hydrolase domain-containing protein [Microvirga sp.]